MKFTMSACMFVAAVISPISVVSRIVPRSQRIASAAFVSSSTKNSNIAAGNILQQRQFSFQAVTSTTNNIGPQGKQQNTHLFACSSSSKKEETKKPISVTLLSGFLGSGKTSALTNLLSNRDGKRVGVIVNDVASVNIDAKLLSNQDSNTKDIGEMLGAGEVVELENGCACCSLADELLVSVQTLLESREDGFDEVVVELSGVADPVAVRQNWADATLMEHPATKLADVNRVVTLVDASTFGTDWMTWNTAGERNGWVEEGDDCSAARKVPELLAEQVEAADVLLINKIDLAGKEQVSIASGLARELNKDAELLESSFGKVDIHSILGTKKKEEGGCTNSKCGDPKCDTHGEEQEASATTSTCGEPKCEDPKCEDSKCEEHGQKEEESCTNAACDDADCSDPDCSDPVPSPPATRDSRTSLDKLAISSFVYTSTTPFHANRLLALLDKWPVPIKEELDIGLINSATKEGYDMGKGQKDMSSPFVGVLRSKGFCWLAPAQWEGAGDDSWRHDTAMYWSHAGKHFGITTAGKWWGSITKDEMKGYFTTNPTEYERIVKEDFKTEEWNDRRQEIVFIGTNLDEEDLTKALNECLLNEKEMDNYRQQSKNFIDTTLAA